jgi:hypothetical protein
MKSVPYGVHSLVGFGMLHRWVNGKGKFTVDSPDIGECVEHRSRSVGIIAPGGYRQLYQ